MKTFMESSVEAAMKTIGEAGAKAAAEMVEA